MLRVSDTFTEYNAKLPGLQQVFSGKVSDFFKSLDKSLADKKSVLTSDLTDKIRDKVIF